MTCANWGVFHVFRLFSGRNAACNHDSPFFLDGTCLEGGPRNLCSFSSGFCSASLWEEKTCWVTSISYFSIMIYFLTLVLRGGEEEEERSLALRGEGEEEERRGV